MTAALDQHASSLTAVGGIGPVLGVRLIGRTGPAARSPSSDAFATYAGVAPIEVSSGQRITHRLSRSGDRQLNSALHPSLSPRPEYVPTRAGDSSRSPKARPATRPWAA
jgi:transposase